MYPVAPVRFGMLYTGGIGHLIENTAIYIEYKARGLLPPALDLIGISRDCSSTNAYMLKKWSEVLEIHPAGVQLAPHVRQTPLDVHELAWYTKAVEWDPYCVMRQSPPPFSFTLQEQCRARKTLESMGVPANAPFVCLLVRDSEFDKNIRRISDEQCAHYQSRNADVNNYRQACEYLVSQGYYVLRMGSSANGPLSWSQKYIIDYAANFRTDFMDIWLFANCALCFGTSSGPMSLSSVLFNRPCLFTDYPHIVWEPMAFMNDLLILPKTPIDASGRRITFDRYVREGFYKSNVPAEFGITLHNNTPDEIVLALKERLSMMLGSWRPSPLLDRLQRNHLELVLSVSEFSDEQKTAFWKSLTSGVTDARRTRIASFFLLADYEQCRHNQQTRR